MVIENTKQHDNTLYLGTPKNTKFTFAVSKSELPELLRSQSPAIVIDNGSFRTKAGFSHEISPRISFPSAVSHTTAKNTPIVLVGNDLKNRLPLSSSQLTSPFSQDIVTDFSLMENTFDYLFDQLLPGSKNIDSPILLTEPVCNPTRHEMSQLLFEYFQVPSLCLGVDFLFSNLYNEYSRHKTRHLSKLADIDAFLQTAFRNSAHKIVLSANHNCTHVSVLNGAQFDPQNHFRLPVGGKTATMYLTETLKTKFPQKSPHLTEKLAHQIYTKACGVSLDFFGDLKENPGDTVIVRHADSHDFYNELMGLFAAEVVDEGMVAGLNIASFRDLEIVCEALQILQCIRLRKEDLSFDYAAFLRLLGEFGIGSEANFDAIMGLLETKIRQLEEIYPSLSIQKTTHYDRVKTRERSRKQKQLSRSHIRVLSGIDEPLRDSKTKYWDCSQLITSEILSEKELLEVITDFKALAYSAFRLELANEPFKTPELFFQPNLVGFQGVGGIGDTLSAIAKSSLSPKEIFVTGGASLVRNFVDRVEKEARAVFPSDIHIAVSSAEDAVFDAWKGAQLFANSQYFKESLTTIEEYRERGAENVFKEHLFSNKYPQNAYSEEEMEFELDE